MSARANLRVPADNLKQKDFAASSMRVVTKYTILFVDIRVCETVTLWIFYKINKQTAEQSTALPSDGITDLDICPHIINQCYITKANTGPAPINLAATGL